MTPVVHLDFAQASLVQKIVDEVNALSDASYNADKAITDIKNNAQTLASKYKDTITALSGFPALIDDSFNTLLWATRDGATNVSSHFDVFVGTMIALVESIESPQDRDDAVAELKHFASKQDPFVEKPLKGFPGVTKELSYIWSILASDATTIQKVLEKTPDDKLEKTVKELEQVLAPAKAGCGKVKEALKQYATRI